jgi:hypothetical protein
MAWRKLSPAQRAILSEMCNSGVLRINPQAITLYTEDGPKGEYGEEICSVSKFTHDVLTGFGLVTVSVRYAPGRSAFRVTERGRTALEMGGYDDGK